MPSNQSEKKQLESCCGVTACEEHSLKSMGAWRKDRKKKWGFNTLPTFAPLLLYNLYHGTQYRTSQLILNSLHGIFKQETVKPSNHAKPSPSSGRSSFPSFSSLLWCFLVLTVFLLVFPLFSVLCLFSRAGVCLTQTFDMLLSLMLNSFHE